MTNQRALDTVAAIPSAAHALKSYLGAEYSQSLWCFTDPERKWLADAFSAAAKQLGLGTYQLVLPDRAYGEADLQPFRALLETMTEEDLVLSIFSEGSAGRFPYYRIFPNFRSPEGFKGTSGVIRQRYPEQALLRHLLTDPASIERRVKMVRQYAGHELRVTAPGGTDVTLQVDGCGVLPYRVTASERHAYLPPAEIYLAVVLGSVNGTLLVDMTVGELATRELGIIDPLGLVDLPVRAVVSAGRVTEVTGGAIAGRLQTHLESLGAANRLVVELGFGLSQGSATGMIAADECLQGTCHFGIGDDSFFGGKNGAPAHLDWVIRAPQVEIIA